jgi:hypothetical protein
VACSAETLRKQLEEAAQTKRVLEEARTELSEKAKLVHIKDTELKELKLKVEMVEKTQAQQPQPPPWPRSRRGHRAEAVGAGCDQGAGCGGGFAASGGQAAHREGEGSAA